MLIYINEAMSEILEYESRTEVAEKIGVSTAMISTWLQKDNDFCPRIAVAKRIKDAYDMVVYPYSDEALDAYRLRD